LGGFFLLWAAFQKITGVAQNLAYFFKHYELCVIFLQKWIGLHFGRLFLQTHLVTLSRKQIIIKKYLEAWSTLSQSPEKMCF
jgi:hypothetical protein